ncbi:hypothetical protein F4775DRAFT_321132 [Biscogniauxia sp. FL1348]|nr:hypothetical protein F4775DRAFT_321132 [Biscogniauxia sp. FL1348]
MQQLSCFLYLLVLEKGKGSLAYTTYLAGLICRFRGEIKGRKDTRVRKGKVGVVVIVCGGGREFLRVVVYSLPFICNPNLGYASEIGRGRTASFPHFSTSHAGSRRVFLYGKIRWDP